MYFRVLGPVEAWDGDIEIPIDGFKERTVLAALLLSRNRVVTDAQLLDLLWGEDPPKTYAAQLYTYVSRLRKRFGGAVVIRRQHPGYALCVKSGELDADRFDQLDRKGHELLKQGRHAEAADTLGRALALWRGPALANVTEALACAAAGRLEEARTAVLEGRIEADLVLGRHDRLVSELTGLVTQYPLRERFRAQLMIALYRSDRQGDAMAVYHDGCRILAEELGVDPGTALRETYQYILVGSEPQRQPAGRSAAVSAGTVTVRLPLGARVARRAEVPAQRVTDRQPAASLAVGVGVGLGIGLSGCPA